jgi:hypothetical protein
MTPLQKLIEFIDKEQGMIKDSFVLEIKKKAESLLPEEKQMVIDAWKDGGSTLSAKNAEQYFNETFVKP